VAVKSIGELYILDGNVLGSGIQISPLHKFRNILTVLINKGEPVVRVLG
jgi:hypothetical protein